MAEIEFFKDVDDTVTYKAGETIFKTGDPDHVLYGVKSGEVDLMFNGEILETLEANNIFGEKTLIDETPHTTTAVAKTDCEIVKVDEPKFLFLVHETPTFALHVMRTLTRRTRTLMSIAVR